MTEAEQASRGWGMRFYLSARLIAAAFEWTLLAFLISAMKAEAGLPAASPEWNRTWADFREWARNPTPLAPLQRLNLVYYLPAGLIAYSLVPVWLVTSRMSTMVLWVTGCVAASTFLLAMRFKKATQLGERHSFRRWAMVLGWTSWSVASCVFPFIIAMVIRPLR
ncbi:MAG TPA: hypothetical protein VGY31_08240 [Terriglobia bacterium]|nr:hypothetical protein [Terriglobia bacterium]